MKNKTICHITSVHSRYDNRIFYKESQSLAADGYKVYLLVVDNLPNEKKDNITVISTNNKSENRIKRMFTSTAIIKKKALEINADVYHLHDPELLRIVKYLKKHNKMVVFDSHEDYPNTIKEKEWIPKILRKLVSFLYEKYEKNILKDVDGIITVTPHIEERLHQINKNTEIITNYPRINKNITKNKFDNSICFVGGVQKFWNIDKILLATTEMDSISFKIAGRGRTEYVDYLKNIPTKVNIEFLGYLNKKEVEELYSKSSVGLCISSYRLNTNYQKGTYGITKFFEYLSYGLPVISTDFEICKKIIDKYKCGLYVKPDDMDAIKSAITSILKDPKRLKKMSDNALKVIENEYNWESQSVKLVKFYDNLYNNNNKKNNVN